MINLLIYALIGAAVAVFSGIAKGSMRRLYMGGAIGVLIAYFAFPFSRSLGNLSRETVDPTLFAISPSFPILFLLPVVLVGLLWIARQGSSTSAWAAVVTGLVTLITGLVYFSQPIHLVKLAPINGLMEALTALLLAIPVVLIGWQRPTTRLVFLGLGVAVGVLAFLWLNSAGGGHTYIPNMKGYYKLLLPTGAGVDQQIVDAYNQGLDERNRIAKENGLALSKPIVKLTDLEGKIPAEAAGQGYRMVQPSNAQYGALGVLLLAGLMLGAGLMQLQNSRLYQNDDLSAGFVLASVFCLLLPAFDATEFNIGKLVSGWPFLVQFAQKSWPPLLADPAGNRYPLQEMLSFMAVTIEIALVGTFLAAILAIPTSFLAARNLTSGSGLMRTAFVFMRGFYNVDRGIDTLILALILVAAVGLGPFAGVVAMAVHSIADLGKLYSEAIENVDKGPIEALESTGTSGINVLRWGILPQVLPLFVSYTVYRFEINFRVSIILGFVGAGGIGFFIQGAMASGQYNQMIIGVIAIVIVVNLIDFASSWLRSRLV